MRKIILFIVALIFSMATCSQIGGRRSQGNTAPAPAGSIPFERKHSVFFEDGTLDEFTESSWNRNDFLYNTERFSASGAMLEQVEFQYNDRNDITTKLTRDVEMRLKNRVVYQYQNDRLWRESLADNRGRIVSQFEYSYDNAGNQTSRIIKNRQGNTLAETLYEFDGQRRIISSHTRDSGENLISYTLYTYDSQGNLTSQQVFDNEGRPTSVISSVFQNGREVRNEIKGADGTVRMRISNEYGNNGELLKRTIENFQGESTQVLTYEYDFRPARRQS